MENRRIEVLPVGLVAIATAALGLACVCVVFHAGPPKVAVTEGPRRTTAPLRWRLAVLPPLPSPALATAVGSLGDAVGASVRVDPPVFSTLTPVGSARLAITDPLAAAALQLRMPTASDSGAATTAPREAYDGRLVVLLPTEPLWRAGDTMPRVVSAPMRRDWSVGAIDTLEAARWMGRLLGAPGNVVEAARLVTRMRVAAAWVREVMAQVPVAPAPRVAAVAPRLVAPATRLATSAVTPAAPVVRFPTIASYVGASSGTGAYPVATSVAQQLDRVAEDPDSAPWAWAVAYRLRCLGETAIGDETAQRLLSLLDEASAEGFDRAIVLGDKPAATELRRASYALSRRVTAWRAERPLLLASLQGVGDSPNRLARQRLAGARWAMSPEGLGLAPGIALADASDSGSTAPAPALRIAQQLEAYETRPTSRLAEILAAETERLGQSGDPSAEGLARSINGHYRNANLRVALAATLIDRLLPQPQPVTSVVRDRIAGTPVTGRATTQTALRVRLTPDEAAWRLGLEAQGAVVSQTVSRGGPARFGSRGSTSFTAQKVILVTPEGLRAAPAVATARAESARLVSLSTRYDNVPLVGSYVRSTAKAEYGRVRSRARAETRVKVERQVRTTFDRQTDTQIDDLERRFQSEVMARAETLGLKVEPIEMRTTAQRVITRVRVAGDRQLGAHTPRMRAPSDSLLSVQLHESTLNNALEGLDLAGLTLTPAELNERLTKGLRLPKRRMVATDKATLRFASSDPLRFRFEEGKAHLTLALDEIAVAGRRHRDFKVHAFYRPVVTGLKAELVQDGSPHIEGRMRTASRMHLHGVMGRVLGENQRVPLVQITDQTPERLSRALIGLATNQFVIEDGWLGLAIGPQRTPGRVAIQLGAYVR